MSASGWSLPDPRTPEKVGALVEFENLAQAHLPRSVFAYVRPGVEADACYDNTLQAFTEWSFAWRVLRGTSTPDMSVELFGKRYAAPFGVAPMGGLVLGRFRGDLEMVSGAARQDIPAIIAGGSTIRMEELRAAAPNAWMQMYMPTQMDQAIALVDRIALAGFEELVITVDTPAPGNRLHFDRLNFNVPMEINPGLVWDGLCHPRWLFGTMLKTLARDGVPHLENWGARRGVPLIAPPGNLPNLMPPRLGWSEVAAIRQRWKGALIIKGILAPEDAVLARDHGVDGIILSTHGGRQMDGAVAPLRVLPDVADAVGNNLTVMIDGGMRWGTDVMKALALGAQFAFVGRPFWFANALGGESLVSRAITLLKEEVRRNMIMMGLTDLAELDATYLVPNVPAGRSTFRREMHR